MNIPEGYVLVPINATSAMIEYGKDERMKCLANPSLSVQGALVRIYSAMIGAAPFVCESNVEKYDEAKERELFESRFGFTNDEQEIYFIPELNCYGSSRVNEAANNKSSAWYWWQACAKSRARSAE